MITVVGEAKPTIVGSGLLMPIITSPVLYNFAT